eukprot:scaffold1988_cov270-Prasinococcus_capsulatus_cf.AAC.11
METVARCTGCGCSLSLTIQGSTWIAPGHPLACVQLSLVGASTSWPRMLCPQRAGTYTPACKRIAIRDRSPITEPPLWARGGRRRAHEASVLRVLPERGNSVVCCSMNLGRRVRGLRGSTRMMSPGGRKAPSPDRILHGGFGAAILLGGGTSHRDLLGVDIHGKAKEREEDLHERAHDTFQPAPRRWHWQPSSPYLLVVLIRVGPEAELHLTVLQRRAGADVKRQHYRFVGQRRRRRFGVRRLTRRHVNCGVSENIAKGVQLRTPPIPGGLEPAPYLAGAGARGSERNRSTHSKRCHSHRGRRRRRSPRAGRDASSCRSPGRPLRSEQRLLPLSRAGGDLTKARTYRW